MLTFKHLCRFLETVQRIVGSRRSLYNLLGRIDDTLRQISGIGNHPLRFRLMAEARCTDAEHK